MKTYRESPQLRTKVKYLSGGVLLGILLCALHSFANVSTLYLGYIAGFLFTVFLVAMLLPKRDLVSETDSTEHPIRQDILELVETTPISSPEQLMSQLPQYHARDIRLHFYSLLEEGDLYYGTDRLLVNN